MRQHNFSSRANSVDTPYYAWRETLREHIILGRRLRIPELPLSVADPRTPVPSWVSDHLVKRRVDALLPLSKLLQSWYNCSRSNDAFPLSTGGYRCDENHVFTTQRGCLATVSANTLQTTRLKKAFESGDLGFLQQPQSYAEFHFRLRRLTRCLDGLFSPAPLPTESNRRRNDSAWNDAVRYPVPSDLDHPSSSPPRRVACALKPSVDAASLVAALIARGDTVVPLPLPLEHALWETRGVHAYSFDASVVSGAHPPSQWSHYFVSGKVDCCITDASSLAVVRGAAALLALPCYVLLPDLAVVVPAAQHDYMQSLDRHYLQRSLQKAYAQQRLQCMRLNKVDPPLHSASAAFTRSASPTSSNCNGMAGALLFFSGEERFLQREAPLLPKSFCLGGAEVQRAASRFIEFAKLTPGDHVLSCLPVQHPGFFTDTVASCIRVGAQLTVHDVCSSKTFDDLQEKLWEYLANQQRPVTVLLLTELQARCFIEALWSGSAGEQRRTAYRRAANHIRSVVIYRDSVSAPQPFTYFPFAKSTSAVRRRRHARVARALAEREALASRLPHTTLVPRGPAGTLCQRPLAPPSLLEVFRQSSRTSLSDVCTKWKDMIHPQGKVRQVLSFLPLGSSLVSAFTQRVRPPRNAAGTRKLSAASSSKRFAGTTYWKSFPGLTAVIDSATNELQLSDSITTLKTGCIVRPYKKCYASHKPVFSFKAPQAEQPLKRQRRRDVYLDASGRHVRNVSPGLPHSYVPKLKLQPKFWNCYYKKRRYWPLWM